MNKRSYAKKLKGRSYRKHLITTIHQAGFNEDNLIDLAIGFDGLKIPLGNPNLVAFALSWAMTDELMMRRIISAYLAKIENGNPIVNIGELI